jgi:hypothetical protein
MKLCLPKSHVIMFCKFFVYQDIGFNKKKVVQITIIFVFVIPWEACDKF